eukprot:15610546-Heterocapsa_arctica.AAC.1
MQTDQDPHALLRRALPKATLDPYGAHHLSFHASSSSQGDTRGQHGALMGLPARPAAAAWAHPMPPPARMSRGADAS